RGGEFSSDLLRAFCRAEGIHQTFTLPASPQQNGIAERRIGMVMEVALSRPFMVGDSVALFHITVPWLLGFVGAGSHSQLVTLPNLCSKTIVAAIVPTEPGGAESGSAEPGIAEPERAESGSPPDVPSRREPVSPQQLREWYTLSYSSAPGARAAGGASEAAGAAGAAGPGGTGAGATSAVGAAGAAGPGGAHTGGTGAARAGGASGVGAARAGGASGVGAAGSGAVDTGGGVGAGAIGVIGARGAAGVVVGDPEGTGAVSAISRGAARPRPYYVPLLQQVLGPPPP
ncbi:unnamed protein product, partial [Closterium sp. NIES-53]